MSGNSTSQPSREVELQPLLIEELGALQELMDAGARVDRRLEARGVFADVDEPALRDLLRRLLRGGLQHSSAVRGFEVGLVAFRLLAPNPRRPELAAGNWLRLSLRLPHDGSADDSAFDQMGVPYLEDWRTLAVRLRVHFSHGWANGRMHLAIEIPARELAERHPTLAQIARVLFVDDETMILEIHRQSIESLGYEVVECDDPQTGVELFRRHPDAFDIVLSDQSMPGMSGDELARRLHAIRPGVPIVLSTGMATPGTRSLAADADIREFLAKPFTMEELSQCLARAIGSPGRHAEG